MSPDDPMRRPMPDDRKPETEPYNAPVRLRRKVVSELQVGESAWIDDWGLALNETGHLYVKTDHQFTSRLMPDSVRILRTKDGFHARLPLIFRPKWKTRPLHESRAKVTKVTYRLHPLGDVLLIILLFVGGLIIGLPDSQPTHYDIICTDLENEVILIDRGTDLEIGDNRWKWTSVHRPGETGIDLTNRRCTYTELAEEPSP